MQQVNLYTEAFRPKKVVLPLEHIILLPVLAIILVVAASFGLSYFLGIESQEVTALQSKNETMAVRLESLEARANKQRKDESLVFANQRLNAKLLARQQMIDMLDTVVVKDDEGFSNILVSLARQKLSKLWLSSIYIGSSGKEMHIEGQTLNADLVPEYLQSLRKESSFLGRAFTLFELEKHSSRKHWINFSLRSEALKAQPEVLLSRLDNSTEMLKAANKQVLETKQ
jgi:hypothetical protein